MGSIGYFMKKDKVKGPRISMVSTSQMLIIYEVNQAIEASVLLQYLIIKFASSSN